MWGKIIPAMGLDFVSQFWKWSRIKKTFLPYLARFLAQLQMQFSQSSAYAGSFLILFCEVVVAPILSAGARRKGLKGTELYKTVLFYYPKQIKVVVWTDPSRFFPTTPVQIIFLHIFLWAKILTNLVSNPAWHFWEGEF